MFLNLFLGDSLVLGTEDGIQMLHGTKNFYFLSAFLLELQLPLPLVCPQTHNFVLSSSRPNEKF